MSTRIEEKVAKGLAVWVSMVARRPLRVVALALALAGGAIAYSLGHLGIEGATEKLFAPDLAFKQSERRFREAFPSQYENMFVVVDAVTPERAGEAAAALLAGLEAEPRLFHAAYLPGGGDFFEAHAFLYLETEELEDLADRLAENQPYLAELSLDHSLHGLTSMLARGVRAVREGDVDGRRLTSMAVHFDEALIALEADEPYHLSWAQVLAANSVDDAATRRFLLVQPILDFNDLQPAREPILAVRRIARELGLTPETGVEVRLTGDVALSYEEMGTVSDQAAMAGLASLALVGTILFIALRSARLVFATLTTLVFGLIYTAGFTAVAIGHFNLISVSFAVLFIGLGVDFGIHTCLRYRELASRGLDHFTALRDTTLDVGSSITLCAFTTAIGFFAFVPTDFVGVAELGLISGVGMFISLACTVTVLPALMSLPPLPKTLPSERAAAPRVQGLRALPLRHPRAIRAAALALGVGAILVLPQARFDNNPLNVRDPSSESVRTFSDLLAKGSTSPLSLNAVVPSIPAAEKIANRLRALSEVGRVVTVADYIPGDQDAKLGIIEDVAMFLAPPQAAAQTGGAPAASVEAKLDALSRLEGQLALLAAERPGNPLAQAAGRLGGSLGRLQARLVGAPDAGMRLATLEAGLIGSLPEQLRILNAALSAGRVTLGNLPGALVERMIASDGRVRIQIFPSGPLADQAAMAAFVDSVRTVTPEVAGSAAEIVESGRAVVAALQQALITAVIVIGLFLLVLWRRVNDTALVLLPLGLGAALTVAAAVLLGIPFNFADVIVLPLLLGIGVDSGIHLVHRARRCGPNDANLLETSTARAVAYSALTTVASFGTMGVATHLGLATLGQLLTLGVSITILCNLVVLPSLIALHAPRSVVADVSRRAA